ncbi:MAG: hypothetical protein ABMA15_00215 [Vicinamibacterales bacterium]
MSSWVVPVLRWQVVSQTDDVFVRVSTAGQHLATWPVDGEAPTHCFLVGQQYWIWQPEFGGATFTADRPELVLCPCTGVDRSQFEQLVWRSWLPAIYPIWHRQVLHASAVASPTGDVIAFTGPSGASKSTTAYALAQRPGWTPVSDDALAFSCHPNDTDAPINLYPLRSEARLRQATAEYFGKSEATDIPFDWPSTCLRLRVIYALDPSPDPSTPVSFTRLKAAESLPLLLAQAHAFSINEPEHNQRLMRDYLSLAVAVPSFRFTFPRTFPALASNLDQLEAHAADCGVNGGLTGQARRRGPTTPSPTVQ